MRSKIYQGLEMRLEPRVQTMKLRFTVCTPFVLGTVNNIINLVE